MSQPHVTVLGAGAWGSALAIHIANHQIPVLLWGKDAKALADYDAARCNTRYLPGQRWPDNLRVCADLSLALANSRRVIVAVPSAAVRAVLTQAAHSFEVGADCLIAVKGFDPAHVLLTDLIMQELQLNIHVAVLSGPSFACELVAGQPTAVVVSSNESTCAQRVQQWLHHGCLRVYVNEDMIGAQVGGALKNIIAIASGISDGLNFGLNTRAALVTRGIAEMARFSHALGGKMETLWGLSGMGDVFACTSDGLSRNRQFGLDIAGGQQIGHLITNSKHVVEGYYATKIVLSMAEHYHVKLPIIQGVGDILFQQRDPRMVVEALLQRPPTREFNIE